MNLKDRPVWREIYLHRLAHNLQEVRNRIGGGPDIMAVVKADAYGHGAVPVARTAVEAGASRIAVALVEEGVELRKAGLEVPVQAMAAFAPEQIDLALDHNIILTVGSHALAKEVGRRARTQGMEARVHVKVDTGMGRYGPLPEEGVDLAEEVYRTPGLILEGLMSHMAAADERDKSISQEQYRRFN